MEETQEDLFLSFDSRESKLGKALILNSEIDLLNALKRLNKIGRLKQQKNKLKLQLHKLTNAILTSMENLEGFLPDPDISEIREKLGDDVEEFDDFDHEVKQSSIEKELREIQEKLKKLNKR